MAEQIRVKDFKTPFGELILGSLRDKLCLADWKYRKMRPAIDKRIQDLSSVEYEAGTSNVIEQTEKQLLEYFEGNRIAFEIPLLLLGTDFQKEVWNELLHIPFGTTLSYLDLSKRMENQKAIRAVASSNGANAISIIIPCHRIIGSKGELTGYAGGLNAKKKLLLHEGVLIHGQMELF